ncbi:MAG TPA: hypothetical protein VEW48_14180 [Thermoanaerobaculia bacterium]|nr:hypothetical protein [Thermoanaerobaculia bacterium]
MRWSRGTFSVLLRVAGQFKPQPFPVAGIVSGAFGIFQGDKKGPASGEGSPRFSLVLVPSGGFLYTYSRQIDCKVLAEELAPLDVAWSAQDAKQITGAGIATARALLRSGQRLAPVMIRGDPAGIAERHRFEVV